ncbi:neugrin [Heteronotia binoei]|uniref:neugrin n=1 Tax=Heteronotia binoei TaxID=13085 RepID=UPI00292EFBC1|nr:neugrin [Heteronotia binoei]
MAARWGRLLGPGLRAGRAGPRELLETEEEAAARLEQERRAKAARLRRVRRLMEAPAGPPERTLSCMAMEQMRFLRQEAPDEWPISRLARSFEVSPEVVGRVLRSRFSPSPERAAKQDSRLPQPPPPQPRLVGPPPPGPLLPPPPHVAPKKRAPPPPASSSRSRRSQGCSPQLQIVQKGREVVDEDGNFLYRIPN